MAELPEGVVKLDFGYSYRGWTFHYDPPPIPIRDFDWQAVHPNYDASWEGEEYGWIDNGLKCEARSIELLCREIDEKEEELTDAAESAKVGIGQSCPPAHGE